VRRQYLSFLTCCVLVFVPSIASAQGDNPFLSEPLPPTKPSPPPPKTAKPPTVSRGRPAPSTESTARSPPAASSSSAPSTLPSAPETVGSLRKPKNSEEVGQDYFQRGYSAYQQQNYSEAISLYSRGADEGNADCMYSMGYLYAGGLGVKPDYRLAQTWYQKSADHGKIFALYNIGLLYLGGGAGVPRDCATARQWFEKAAAKGVSLARDWLTANPSCS
jgi:tetratricopeptide (TPR) repeat protein